MPENNQKYNDGQLINDIRKNDIKAFDILFAKYSKKIYGFAFRYLKSDVDAEGVVQDVFMYIWNNRGKLQTDTNFRSYLFSISMNLIRKVFRREAYKSKFLSESFATELDNSVDEKMEYASLLEEVDKLIEKMPERRRNIFIKSRKLGMSSKEIAKELGITPGAVDNQVSEALKFLRDKIDKEILFILLIIFLY
jgi:RNA polymerase sigma-70 factor (ECF subfamily)